PWRGQFSREIQGVRITPMNTRPASNDFGASTATSLGRISFNLTMIRLERGPWLQTDARLTMNRFSPRREQQRRRPAPREQSQIGTAQRSRDECRPDQRFAFVMRSKARQGGRGSED